jgi:hypothetical protein
VIAIAYFLRASVAITERASRGAPGKLLAVKRPMS